MTQLFDTIQMRNGIMVVGKASTGKSTVINQLRKAYGTIQSENKIKVIDDERFKIVKHNVVNPKSMSIQRLYGFVNLLTNEWNDGIIGKIFKQNSKESLFEYEWLIFDG